MRAQSRGPRDAQSSLQWCERGREISVLKIRLILFSFGLKPAVRLALMRIQGLRPILWVPPLGVPLILGTPRCGFIRVGERVAAQAGGFGGTLCVPEAFCTR